MSRQEKYYKTHFSKAYTEEFPAIIASRKGEAHAFCSVCRCDFTVSHSGRGDILKHVQTKKHQDGVKCVNSNRKLDFSVKNDTSVIRAECYFTAFIVEHNLPLSCADHAGPLFRKMFPDSDISKRYSCARTKSSSILGEMELQSHAALVENLKTRPFSIATDGSNQGDAKLYPIVVTLYNGETLQIESRLLALPVLEGNSTGVNIGNLLLHNLKDNGIPLSNCLALSADNAPVMVGEKNGVAGVLKNEINSLIVIGCPCHLIDLCSEKAASCFPVKIEEFLVDIFFYLEKSEKRKEKLKQFQKLYDTEVRKILKHVCTRWLSLGKCLGRLIEQWEPLCSFFMDENKPVKQREASSLLSYRIPKIKSTASVKHIVPPQDTSCKPSTSTTEVDNQVRPILEIDHRKGLSPKNPATKKRSSETEILTSKKSKPTKHTHVETSTAKFLSREERLFMFLSSDLNKAFCLFLLHAIPIFEKPNVLLQSSEPHIHELKSILLDLFKNLISRFVKPSVVKSCTSLLETDYHNKSNQKCDSDLIIGNAAYKLVEKLKEEQKRVFFSSVRKYFETACDYMLHKFPLKNDVLTHSEVVCMQSLSSASFSSVRYFVDRFPSIMVVNERLTVDEEMDILQSQFCAFQFEEVPEHIAQEERMDTKWALVGKMKNSDGSFKYDRLARVMLAILTIPHSNAECERLFSQVKKNRTQFRSSMSDQTLEKVVKVKSSQQGLCHEQNFSEDFLKKAKSATFNLLNKS